MSDGVYSSSGSRTPLLLAIVGALVVFGWTWVARAYFGSFVDRDSLPAINRARGIIDDHLAITQSRLRAECQLLAADGGIRALLRERANPESFIYQLNEQRRYLGADLLALVSLSGRTYAASGDEALMGVDLSESQVIKAALSSTSTTSSGVWGSRGKLLPVAACPIRFGEQVEMVVVVGLAVKPAELKSIWSLTDAGGAVVLGGTIVSAHPQNRAFIETFKSQKAGAPAQVTHGDTTYWVRTDDVGDRALPVRLLWWRPSGQPSGIATALVYSPLFSFVFFAIAALALCRGQR